MSNQVGTTVSDLAQLMSVLSAQNAQVFVLEGDDEGKIHKVLFNPEKHFDYCPKTKTILLGEL